MDEFYKLVIYFTICLLIFLIMYFKFMNLNVFESFIVKDNPNEETRIEPSGVVSDGSTIEIRKTFPAGMCVECPSNTIVNESKTGCEHICLEGSIFNLGICTECQDGQQPNRDRTLCIDCLAGTAGTGGICTSCAENSYSTQGASSCVECIDGQRANDGNTRCERCPTGWAGKGGTCEQCPEGYQAIDNSTTCGPCPAGWAGSEGVCNKCTGNKYSTGGASECTTCPEGSSVNENKDDCEEIQLKYVGEECSSGDDCYSGMCELSIRYGSTTEEKLCKGREYGEYCDTARKHCSTTLYCRNNRCGPIKIGRPCDGRNDDRCEIGSECIYDSYEREYTCQFDN